MWSDVIIYDKYTEIKMEPFSKIRSPITTLSFYNYPTTVHVRVDTHVDHILHWRKWTGEYAICISIQMGAI